MATSTCWSAAARRRTSSSRRAPGSRALASVPNPKSVTKVGGVSTTLAALLLLGIAPTIPRRRALPAPPSHPRLWQDFGSGTLAGGRGGRSRELDQVLPRPAEGQGEQEVVA